MSYFLVLLAGLLLGVIVMIVLVTHMKHLVSVSSRGKKFYVTYLGDEYELNFVQKVEFY